MMQLSDYDQMSEEKKIEINEFVEQNIETIYDKRYAYGTRIDLSKQHLNILDDKTIKDEFVEDNYVGYWCNKCENWVEEGTSDIALIKHIIKHLDGIINEEIE